MSQPVILRQWAVVADMSPYTPPECRVAMLRGKPVNHPGFAPNETINTSRIVSADGRVITCASRQYLLDGPPAADYVEYLHSIGRTLDEKNPVLVA